MLNFHFHVNVSVSGSRVEQWSFFLLQSSLNSNYTKNGVYDVFKSEAIKKSVQCSTVRGSVRQSEFHSRVVLDLQYGNQNCFVSNFWIQIFFFFLNVCVSILSQSFKLPFYELKKNQTFRISIRNLKFCLFCVFADPDLITNLERNYRIHTKGFILENRVLVYISFANIHPKQWFLSQSFRTLQYG